MLNEIDHIVVFPDYMEIVYNPANIMGIKDGANRKAVRTNNSN